jgi:autotransporter-associated beta strand protein
VIPLCLARVAFAQPSAPFVIQKSFSNLNLTIPDNDPSGIVHVQTISGSPPGSVVLDVNVTLRLSGVAARNGDLYATLDHLSGYSILLNRVGRTTNNPAGYGDPGFAVNLDDEGANGDIHVYRARLFGNHETPLGEALSSAWSGGWAPDGRNVDPDFVLAESPRRGSLSSMKGLPVDGRWRLFLADVAEGGISELTEWSLEIRATTNADELELDLTDATIRADGQDRVITVPVTIRGDLAVSGGAGTTLGGPVRGPGQVVKDGGGNLSLSGVNTFSGGIALEDGALVLDNDRATGLGPISVKGGSIRAKGGAKRVDNALTLAGDVEFGSGDALEFAGVVTLQGSHALKVENETVISGDIQESEPGAGFLKTGGGKLTLSGVNTFSGGIALEEGTLAIGNDRALGTGPLKVTGGNVEAVGGSRTVANPVRLAGKLAFTGADLLAFTGPLTLDGESALTVGNTTVLSGPLSEAVPGLGFAKSGQGTLVLEGANTISGGVNIEEGRLAVNNSNGSATGTGAVTVGGRATLSGRGTIAGAVSLSAGATLDPGSSPGSLTTGSQSWPGGAVLVWEINRADGLPGGDPGWDNLIINGDLAIRASASSKFTVQIVSLGSANTPGPSVNFDSTQDYVWTMARTTGGVLGFDPDGVILDTTRFENGLNGGRLALEVRGNDLVIVFDGVRPPRIRSVQRSTSALQIYIEGEANQEYRIETTIQLAPANWAPAGTVTANASGAVVFEAPLSPDNVTRFYRVVAP